MKPSSGKKQAAVTVGVGTEEKPLQRLQDGEAEQSLATIKYNDAVGRDISGRKGQAFGSGKKLKDGLKNN